MIDRTTFDLRIADHGTTTARIERQGWQRQGEGRSFRATVAAALISLANLLAPVQQPIAQQVQTLQKYRFGA